MPWSPSLPWPKAMPWSPPLPTPWPKALSLSLPLPKPRALLELHQRELAATHLPGRSNANPLPREPDEAFQVFGVNHFVCEVNFPGRGEVGDILVALKSSQIRIGVLH